MVSHKNLVLVPSFKFIWFQFSSPAWSNSHSSRSNVKYAWHPMFCSCLGHCELGPPGTWATGNLGHRELGPLGTWATWEVGPLGTWATVNTGYSCDLAAVRRRRGRFFSPIGSGPRGSGLWNGDRDKHWEQLLFISGPSSPGAVFFSYWIWAQGQRLVEWGYR